MSSWRSKGRRRPGSSRKTVVLAALQLTAVAALCACAAATPGAGNHNDTATIMVTTNILGDITRNIVGDSATVVVLMEANADPHSFGVSARQAGDMEQADLIVFNGLGLEEGVLSHIESAKAQGVPVMEAGQAASPLTVQGSGAADTLDPHFWTDPQRVLTVVGAIEDAVAQHVGLTDPALLRSSAAAYESKITELDQWMAGEFAALPADRRKIITNHHVFGYLAQRFDLDVIGAVVPSGTTLAAPSASDLSDLAGAIDDTGVPAIFVDTSQPDKLATVLAEEANVQVQIVPLFSESLSAAGEGADTYVTMMQTNTHRMTAALSALTAEVD